MIIFQCDIVRCLRRHVENGEYTVLHVYHPGVDDTQAIADFLANYQYSVVKQTEQVTVNDDFAINANYIDLIAYGNE